MNLTSRKLAAAIAGMVAIVTCLGFVAFGAATETAFEKAILAVGGITLTAIGAQALVDTVRK